MQPASKIAMPILKKNGVKVEMLLGSFQKETFEPPVYSRAVRLVAERPGSQEELRPNWRR